MRNMCKDVRQDDKMDYDFVRQAIALIRVPDRTYQVLFQEIGKALWSIQFFEDALATYLVGAFEISKETAAKTAWKILEDTRRSTAGALLKKLREKAKLSPKGDELLTHLVSERNWMVHRLQHENQDDLYDERRFARVIARIRALGRNALDAQMEFERLLREWTMKHGATQSQIDATTLSGLRAKREKHRTT